ncbi:MAG: PEGA domain-containing protein [Candidatus Berkelbacteria bacterium]|nr:PEGA domain-containing protein [Candidatus Berkelbacteria bacterium]
MRLKYIIIVGIIFLACVSLALIYVTGYQIDLVNKDIKQTGIISVQTDNANIYLDDKLVGNGRVTLRNITPNSYNIKVTKEGYHIWEKNIKLEAGEAEILNNIVLFKENIIPREFSVDQNDFFNKIADTAQIRVDGGEIYQNDQLVTRFDKNIYGASWYPNNQYIAFTYNAKLHIMEIDATNDIEILDKDSQTPIVFVNSGKSVIYENNGKVYQADIR